MSSQVVTYRVDKSTVVGFEYDPPPGFRPAGAKEIAGQVREAVGPAVEAARAVLDKVTEIRPERVEVKFGIKVSGGASWLVARAAAEGNFEVTLSWAPKGSGTENPRIAATGAGDPGKAGHEHR